MSRLTDENKEIISLLGNNESYWLSIYFKLKEYEDLEEQGLLFKSPYKIGDIFYLCTYRIIIRLKISCIEFRHDNTAFYRTYVADTGELGIPFGINDIGKTVFLTREEAEKALERLECAEWD